MIERRQSLLLILMIFLLGAFGTLYLSTVRVSALESPAIYISPAWTHAEDPTSAIGVNFTFSVYTDYDGSDVWGYEFALTFNSSVLEGADVVNGDLITEGVGTTMWSEGTYNNTVGTLSLTGNGFFALPPADPPVTSGPGILANVTFTVVGYGISSIALGDDTRLIGYDSVLGDFNIIDDTMIGHIEGGIFYNTFWGDITGPEDVVDKTVDVYDLAKIGKAYGSSLGSPNWDQDADITGPADVPDGTVENYDLALCGEDYGKSI